MCIIQLHLGRPGHCNEVVLLMRQEHMKLEDNLLLLIHWQEP